MRAIQWAPSGNPFDGKPGEILQFLSKDGKSYGCSYGQGWTMVFGSPQGDIEVEAAQWIVIDDNGIITVQDEDPNIPSPNSDESAPTT